MNNNGTKLLESGRLILRKFVVDDAAQFFYNCACDKNVTKFFGFEPDESIAQTKEKLECFVKRYDEDNAYIWAIQEKKSSEIIGSITADVPYKFLQICEAGYSIGSKWWNLGYATEAVKAVIRYLLTEEDMYMIEAKVNVENTASGKVLIKAGMTKEAVLRDRRINKTTGKREDLAVYSIVKSEINQ